MDMKKFNGKHKVAAAVMTAASVFVSMAGVAQAADKQVTTAYEPQRDGRHVAGNIFATNVASTGLARPASWDPKLVWRDYSNLPALPSPYNGNPVQLTNGSNSTPTVDFHTLPLHLSFVRVHGKGTRKIAVFLTTGLETIKTFERQLNGLDDVTIYTFIIPSGDGRLENQIMCQPTPQARAIAWEKAILLAEMPPSVTPCDAGAKKMVSTMQTIKRLDGSPFLTIVPGLAVEKNNMLTDLRKTGIPLDQWKHVFSWKP